MSRRRGTSEGRRTRRRASAVAFFCVGALACAPAAFFAPRAAAQAPADEACDELSRVMGVCGAPTAPAATPERETERAQDPGPETPSPETPAPPTSGDGSAGGRGASGALGDAACDALSRTMGACPDRAESPSERRSEQLASEGDEAAPNAEASEEPEIAAPETAAPEPSAPEPRAPEPRGSERPVSETATATPSSPAPVNGLHLLAESVEIAAPGAGCEAAPFAAPSLRRRALDLSAAVAPLHPPPFDRESARSHVREGPEPGQLTVILPNAHQRPLVGVDKVALRLEAFKGYVASLEDCLRPRFEVVVVPDAQTISSAAGGDCAVRSDSDYMRCRVAALTRHLRQIGLSGVGVRERPTHEPRCLDDVSCDDEALARDRQLWIVLGAPEGS